MVPGSWVGQSASCLQQHCMQLHLGNWSEHLTIDSVVSNMWFVSSCSKHIYSTHCLLCWLDFPTVYCRNLDKKKNISPIVPICMCLNLELNPNMSVVHMLTLCWSSSNENTKEKNKQWPREKHINVETVYIYTLKLTSICVHFALPFLLVLLLVFDLSLTIPLFVSLPLFSPAR